MSNKYLFSNDDLVFHKENGRVKAGGYVINSPILQKGGAAIKNLNVSNGMGVEKLAIPAGLFLVHKNEEHSDDLNISKQLDNIGTVSDGLFDNLYNMLGGGKKGKKRKKRKTKRNRKKNKKTTRKRR